MMDVFVKTYKETTLIKPCSRISFHLLSSQWLFIPPPSLKNKTVAPAWWKDLVYDFCSISCESAKTIQVLACASFRETNKTTSYYRHALRPPILVKMPFLKKKAFFFNILCFFIIFSNFSNLKNFCFLARKTSKIKWKDIFKKKQYLICILQKNLHSESLKKFEVFLKKPIYFSKKNEFWTFWEVLLFQSHSSTNLLQFGEKIFRVQKRERTSLNMRERNWQASGKETHPFEWMTLLPFL